MSSTAFIEPLPVIDFVIQLLNRDVSTRPLSDADRVKVRFFFSCLYCMHVSIHFLVTMCQRYFHWKPKQTCLVEFL